MWAPCDSSNCNFTFYDVIAGAGHNHFYLEIVAKLFYVRAIEMICGSQRSGFHGQRCMPSLISLTNVRVYICLSSYTYPKKVKIISLNKNYLERPLTGCNCCMQKS